MNGVLVTGAGGLLGSAVRQECPDAIFVGRTECDLRELAQVRALFERYRPRCVLHLAALVGGVRRNAAQNADLLTDNVQINTNVLSVAAALQIPRLISIVSSCAFQTWPDRPSTERDLHEGMPFEGNLGYGMAKRLLDVHTRLLSKQYAVHYSTIAPVTMYGAHDNWELEEGHVVASLIRKALTARERRQPLEVWGSGQAVRQFVYARDVARLLLQAVEGYRVPETLVVAADRGITIRELVEMVVKVTGFDGEVRFDTTRPEGQRLKVVLSNKFQSYFQDFQFTSLENGLRETVAAIAQQRPW